MVGTSRRRISSQKMDWVLRYHITPHWERMRMYVHSIEPAQNQNSLKNLYVMALGDSDISELKEDQIHYITKSIEELLSLNELHN